MKTKSIILILTLFLLCNSQIVPAADKISQNAKNEYEGIVKYGHLQNFIFSLDGVLSDILPVGTKVRGSVFNSKGSVSDGGTIIAEQRHEQYDNMLNMYKSIYKAAAIDLEIIERDFKRQKKLRKTASISEKELEKATAHYFKAKGKVDQLKFKINDIEGIILECKIIAPFDGIVSNAYYSPGEFINNQYLNNNPVIQLVNMTPMKIYVKLPQLISSKLSPCSKIMVYPLGVDKPVGGKLEHKDNKSNSTNIYVDNPMIDIYPMNENMKKLPQVQLLSYIFTRNDINHVLVRIDALKKDKKGAFVWLANSQLYSNPVKPIKRIFSISKVYVKPENIYRYFHSNKYQSVLPLKEKLNKNVVIVVDIHGKLGSENKIVYNPKKYLFRAGDKVKVKIINP